MTDLPALSPAQRALLLGASTAQEMAAQLVYAMGVDALDVFGVTNGEFAAWRDEQANALSSPEADVLRKVSRLVFVAAADEQWSTEYVRVMAGLRDVCAAGVIPRPLRVEHVRAIALLRDALEVVRAALDYESEEQARRLADRDDHGWEPRPGEAGTGRDLDRRKDRLDGAATL